MTGWYFYQMLLIFKLAVYILASTDTELCHGCQTPLVQNRHFPWWHLLNDKMNHFSGLNFAKMIQVIPKYSFVAGPSIQVSICDSYYAPWIVLTIGFYLLYFGLYLSFWCILMTPAPIFANAASQALGQSHGGPIYTGINLDISSSSERRRYYVMPFLIGRAHAPNDPCQYNWSNPTGSLWRVFSVKGGFRGGASGAPHPNFFQIRFLLQYCIRGLKIFNTAIQNVYLKHIVFENVYNIIIVFSIYYLCNTPTPPHPRFSKFLNFTIHLRHP